MSARHSNRTAAARTARRVRARESTGESLEALLALIATSSELVDAATAADSDVSATGRANCIRVHARLLDQLEGLIGVPPSDGWDEFLAFMETPTLPEAGSR